MLSHGRRNCMFAEVINVERQIKNLTKNKKKVRNWLHFSSWHDSCHCDTCNKTDCNGHASLSAISHVCPCVCLRARSCVSDTVFCWLGLSVLSGGCCSSLVFLPWPAYEKAAVLITWSTGLLIRHTLLSWHLLITRSFFRNSFLDFILALLCSLLRRNKSLSIWLNVGKRTCTCAPFTTRCCGTMSAFHREKDEINMSGGDTCNAVMSEQHTPSL